MSTPYSPELLEAAAGIGIDPSVLGALGSGGGSSVSDEPMVFYGESRTARATGDVSRYRGGKPITVRNQIPLSQANMKFYELNQNQLIDLQQRLALAGLIDPAKTRFGDYEEASFSAFSQVNERAARFYAAGQKRSPNDVLNMAMTAAFGSDAFEDIKRQADEARERAKLSFDTRINTYERSDPASLRQVAEAAFQEALGRKPRKGEQERFVNGFLARQESSQRAVFDVQDAEAAASRDRALAGVDLDEAGAIREAGGENGVAGSAGMSESDLLWQRVNQMIADSPYKDKVKPGARTRSYAEQVAAKEREKRGGPKAATPGKSKHGDGRANDIQGINSDPAIRKWFHENAARYGLAFPIYNPNLPTSKNEAWHVELAKGGATGKQYAAPGSVTPAPISRDVTVQQQDAGAQAIEQARNENPVETGAVDIRKQFDSFLNIMGGGLTR